jgi:osmoprotectant transport system permease protein
MKIFFFAALLFVSGIAFADNSKPIVTVGSKAFTEGYILGEIIAQTLEQAGEVQVTRKFGLGGTGVPYEALMKGSIDLYPEYSGTISEAILKIHHVDDLRKIRKELIPLKLVITDSLGFNNTYALAMNGKIAEAKNIKTISNLKNFSDIKTGFSHEFVSRPDGYPGLSEKYNLKLKNFKALEHSLAYEAIDRGEIDMTDAYSTDAKIQRFNLRILQDDKHFFPDYYAVILARQDFVSKYPKSWRALKKLEETISAEEMQYLNGLSDIDKKSFAQIAGEFLNKNNQAIGESVLRKVWVYTKQHLALVCISLFLSIIIGLPLAILAARFRKLGRVILIVSGIVQTVPSLALLCFLIPFFGIGTLPALVALFLYGLLPIVINTYTSLIAIDFRLIESSRALGLSGYQRLTLIELPLSAPAIMAGIKTSAIINIGTATLAALIGAGGYGTPIVTGLALNDMSLILQGAIPAALMSLIAYGFFEIADRIVIPKGLR